MGIIKTNTLRWTPPAVTATAFKIRADKGGPGVWADVVASQAIVSATPVTTTLDGDILKGATALTMASATNFANNDHCIIDKELFLLAGKSGNIFSGVEGGRGGTTKQPHNSGATITKCTESYSDANVDFGTLPGGANRHVIRYRIFPIVGGVALTPEEVVAVAPTPPEHGGFRTMHGMEIDSAGKPLVGIAVHLVTNQGADYALSSSESILGTTIEVLSDLDGYWEIPAMVDDEIGGTTVRTLIRNAKGPESQRETHPIKTVPPGGDFISYLECI
jgi:hypothetical protein